MKKLLALTLTAAFAFVAAPTKDAEARKRTCKARYTYKGKTTRWYNLGKVGGFLRNKKKKCLRRAKARLGRYAKQLFRKSSRLCGKRFRIWIDTQVASKRNSRDGYGYVSHGGYRCKRICRNRYRKAASCKMPRGLRVAKPYTIRGGYLYRYYRVCRWRIY